MARTPVVVLRGGTRLQLAERVAALWQSGTATWVVDPTWPPARVAALGSGLLADTIDDLTATGAVSTALDVPADTASIVTTSGTTGEPKVLVLTAPVLDASADGAHHHLGATSRDRWLLALPLHHVAGQSVVWRSRRLGRFPVVQQRIDAHASRQARATLAALVPTQLRRIVDAGARLDATVLLGGGAISPTLVDDARTGDHVQRVVRSYGLTETAGGCVYDGRAFPGTEVATTDGRLRVRGPTLAAGQLTTDGLRPIVDDDGWLHTADLGTVGDDGRVDVVGRADDVIVTGAVKVAPAVVEVALEDHAAIARAAVVGLPDRHWGEVVTAAVVVVAPVDDDELRDHVRQTVAAAAVPRRILRVPHLPMTTLGKVDRRAVRRRLQTTHG